MSKFKRIYNIIIEFSDARKLYNFNISRTLFCFPTKFSVREKVSCVLIMPQRCCSPCPKLLFSLSYSNKFLTKVLRKIGLRHFKIRIVNLIIASFVFELVGIFRKNFQFLNILTFLARVSKMKIRYIFINFFLFRNLSFSEGVESLKKTKN